MLGATFDSFCYVFQVIQIKQMCVVSNADWLIGQAMETLLNN